MRKLVAVMAIVAAALAASGPAWAKMVGKAVIEGEGLDGAIVLRGEDGVRYPAMANFFEGPGAPEAPTDALGPRYTARFDMKFPPGQEDIVQHLYPFAEGGPLVSTPPGQPWPGGAETAPSGWFPMRGELLDVLRGRGLPAVSPAPVEAIAPVDPVAPVDAAADARPATAAGPSPAVWGIALLAGIAVIAAVARRRAVRNV